MGYGLYWIVGTIARPKKISPKANRKGRSPKRTAVVWIAPDLERITKGERGRRGLADPTSGYYLRLADLALKGVPAAGFKADQPMSGDEMLFSMPFPLGHESERPLSTEASQPKLSRTKRRSSPTSAKQPRIQVPRQKSLEHPKLALPRLQPPKLPKFDPPKPPKTPKKPKPPRHGG